MGVKQTIAMEPHPLKVLVKISKHQWSSLFSNKIRRIDGTEVKLFIDIPAEDGEERRFQQNVSIGTIVAVGRDLDGFQKGDMAILNYLVTGNDDALIGNVNGDRMVSIFAHSKKHTTDGPEFPNGLRPWVKGDYEIISDLLGIVRMGKLVALRPYILVKYESPKLKVGNAGVVYESEEDICTREVLAAHRDSGYRDGDKVIVRESNLIFRTTEDKIIGIVMEQDVIGVM